METRLADRLPSSLHPADSFSSLPVVVETEPSPQVQVSPRSARSLNPSPALSQPSHFYVSPLTSRLPPKPLARSTADDKTFVVKGLPRSTSARELHNLLSPFGIITATTIELPTDTESRGKAYITFESSGSRDQVCDHQASFVIRNNHLRLFRASARNHQAAPAVASRSIAVPSSSLQPTTVVRRGSEHPLRSSTPKGSRAHRAVSQQRPVLEASGIASLLTNIRPSTPVQISPLLDLAGPTPPSGPKAGENPTS